MRNLVLIAALAAATALPAYAQLSPAEQRMQDNVRALELYPQQQRLNELDSRVFELEQQRRTLANQQTLDAQARALVIQPVILIPPAQPPVSKQIQDAESQRLKGLEESAKRLEALAEQINN